MSLVFQSVFGTPQQTQSTSIFGGLNTSGTTAPTSGGLFGSTTATQVRYLDSKAVWTSSSLTDKILFLSLLAKSLRQHTTAEQANVLRLRIPNYCNRSTGGNNFITIQLWWRHNNHDSVSIWRSAANSVDAWRCQTVRNAYWIHQHHNRLRRIWKSIDHNDWNNWRPLR